jgi:hypothetical protein
VLIDENGLGYPRATIIGGDIYVVGGRYYPLDFHFLRSSDHGRTWSAPVLPADTFYNGSLQPDVACTSDGKVHVVWLGQYEGQPESQIFHQSSSDGGRHWSNRHRVFNNRENYAEFPALAACGDTLFVAFRNIEHLLFFRSFDAGRTWRDSTAVDSADGLLSHPEFLHQEGRLHLIYELNLDRVGVKICHRYSDDFGLTWSPRVYLPSIEPGPPYFYSHLPAASVDGAGHIAAVWADYQYGNDCDGTGEILGRVSTDNGDTWGPEARLTFTQTAEMPTCVVADGAVYAAWPDARPLGCGYRTICLSASRDWGFGWSPPEVITDTSLGREMVPFLFSTRRRGVTFIHCLYSNETLSGTHYIRDKGFYSDRMPVPDDQPVCLRIGANPPGSYGSTAFKAETATGGGKIAWGPAEPDAVDDSEIPDYFEGLRAYPNPFNSTTTLTIEGGEDAQIEIYDLAGRRVAALRTENGRAVWVQRGLGSGVYFARVGGGATIAIKLVYLK